MAAEVRDRTRTYCFYASNRHASSRCRCLFRCAGCRLVGGRAIPGLGSKYTCGKCRFHGVGAPGGLLQRAVFGSLARQREFRRSGKNTMSRVALITGVSGQDGAYLAAQSLACGDQVVGARRPGSGADSLWRLRELDIVDHPSVRLVELDITDSAACHALLRAVQPFALFHLAGQSRVAESFRDPLTSARVNAMGTLHLLDAVRRESPQTRFVLASTAELFGDAQTFPQNEATPFAPRNPYAVAKQFAHSMTQSYRASFGLHASCAIAFNHESPLRDADFVTRKIAAAAVRL